ncbi:DUF2271 domain-containing protein [Rubritalea sp.]|uniref:DUF2271 domain-containing protein n=1 Tax=Rubritalea sp. TaxID=2109375 RepID=UPI003EF31751
MKAPIAALLATPLISQTYAAEIQVNIEIPRLNVAEYHRPYVAAWIEGPDRSNKLNISVWYDTEMKKDGGEKWLKDLRQWWRKSGRALDMPVEGVSSPTKPAGTHKVTISADQLPPLKDGQYTLVVEASREVGGREIISIPFTWDGTNVVTQEQAGERELGKITLKIQ